MIKKKIAIVMVITAGLFLSTIWVLVEGEKPEAFPNLSQKFNVTSWE